MFVPKRLRFRFRFRLRRVCRTWKGLVAVTQEEPLVIDMGSMMIGRVIRYPQDEFTGNKQFTCFPKKVLLKLRFRFKLRRVCRKWKELVPFMQEQPLFIDAGSMLNARVIKYPEDEFTGNKQFKCFPEMSCLGL